MRRNKIKGTALLLALLLTALPLCACAPKQDDGAVRFSVAEKGGELLAAASFDDVMREISGSVADSLIGAADGQTTEVCGYAGETGATAELLLLIYCENAADTAAVVTLLGKYRDAQIADFTSYNPPEVPKLQAALILTRGHYVLYCVGKDHARLSAMFDGYFAA